MKQFCMKIDLISQGRENVLFLPSSMAAMTSHENALLLLQNRIAVHGFLGSFYSYQKLINFIRIFQLYTPLPL